MALSRSRWTARTALIVLGTLLVVLAALVSARYRPSINRARARISAGSQVVSSRCGLIEYGERGSGAPILVVHGAGGGFDQGLWLGDELSRAGFRVIAPSRFGYLGTPLPPDASAQAQADAHACLLDALQIPRAAIMGVSAGGPSALQFALRFPERTRALVLLVPAVYAPRPAHVDARASRATLFLFDTALRSDFLFWAATRVARPTMIRSILGTPPELLASAGPAEQARLETMLDEILPVSSRRLGLLNDAQVVSSLTRYDLQNIGAPTLAISTADDGYHTFDGAKYTAEQIPHARFVGYPNGGHMLVGRNTAASNEIVGFLRSVPGE
jgi:2-hydroxy-6-oxonona-2,4-dienedioate hydrolase